MEFDNQIGAFEILPIFTMNPCKFLKFGSEFLGNSFGFSKMAKWHQKTEFAMAIDSNFFADFLSCAGWGWTIKKFKKSPVCYGV